MGDSEVLPSQRGELGQGRLSKQIGQSGTESLACSVVGQSGAESLACSVVGQSGVESLACLEKSPTEGVGVRFSGSAMVRAGVTGGGPEKQSGPDSRETNRVPIRASCIAGVRRARNRRQSQTQRHYKAQKLHRVAEPTPEVEIAEGDPCDVHETAGGTVMMEAGEADEADEEVGEVPDHIEDLVARSVKGWSHPQQQAIKRLLIKHAEVFSKDEFDIGRTDLFEHEIDMGNAKPIRSAPRPMAYGLAEGGKKTISKLLEKGLIHRSVSPWAAPVTLVAKKDGTVRLTIDYRRLNAVTKVPASTIPKVQDCVDALEGAAVYSQLDSGLAYYQLRMKESDIPKTAFITRYGHFEMVSMPMGLSNAPQAFTRLMELALAGLQWTTCVIYLDDVIIFGKTVEEHLS